MKEICFTMLKLRWRWRWILLLFLVLFIFLSAIIHRPDGLKDTEGITPAHDGLRIVQAAAAILERRPLLVTIINDGFVPMTYNWLCHTAGIPNLHDDILLLAEDDVTRQRVQRDWPRLHIVSVESAGGEGPRLSGELNFYTVAYVRMMALRTRLLNELLQAGYAFVLFETDFVWFENPVPDFLDLARTKNLDLVGTNSSVDDQIMCGAFIYFRNTSRTRAVWAEVTRLMEELVEKMKVLDPTQSPPRKQNEQRYLNRLLVEKHKGIRYGLVDFETSVIDGVWYKFNKTRRQTLHPKAIHNNFLDTTREKVKRFKDFGQWVLNDDNTCNKDKVQKLLEGK
ncbi:UDP-D-xylose:L-fucose alpha-1,3-D-xylosyltransferase 1-like isoform X2 [Pomacea canaliculata]|uniref:UDP-D-xylose:L-fucose alpha-1,3-D-xylosyltransferase 1-like isoform X2 n=1 Tax=Pomacea canaliculata TaxID=400727 RepID=UPI000D7273AF|nr:UDP-D-xylose:L-fucose alpha-1,3-D-xylosyltransferase 1-like isoform X2 [Pomacea canaliculata]